MLNNRQIEAIVRNGFHPLSCGFRFRDSKWFDFRVFGDNGRPLVSLKRNSLKVNRSPYQLAGIISEIRSRVEARGCALDPWQMPKLA